MWDGRRPKSNFIQGHEDFEERQGPHSWVDIFLRDDVYILGSSLDYAEIDLWWLLVFQERQKLKVTKGKNISRMGNTVFYYLYEGRISNRDKGRLSLLQSIGVETEAVECSRSYEHSYHQILSRIKGLGLSPANSRRARKR